MTQALSPFAEAIYRQKYSLNGAETWEDTATRVVASVATPALFTDNERAALLDLVKQRKFMPGGRYLYAAGRAFHQVSNCLLCRAEDSREGWADLMYKATMGLMTGAGLGVDYSGVRPKGAPVTKTGGTSTGPLALMQMVNEAGRHIMQGGARRSALWAGLRWDHPDVHEFIALKSWSPEIQRLKAADFNSSAPLDGTNISVILDRQFFEAYAKQDPWALGVYWAAVRSMLQTGEPGFSVDMINPKESLRNPCCEVVSTEDSDICNLGSLNLARFDTLEEFAAATKLATAFLLAGTLYSDLPYPGVVETQQRHRRIGLGLLGVHEWLMKRGLLYTPNQQFGSWLAIWCSASNQAAADYATAWRIVRPIAVRAIAPTGTIGIVAETTTGAEPMFCAAYRRRYKGPDGHSTHYQYVVDPVAKRMVEAGADPASLEDAYTLAAEPERRVAFQAWLQGYVDNAISSTINLPAWGSEHNSDLTVQSFGDMLLTYLPQLRGVTVYPDGARSGQPLVRVAYETAVGKEGQVFYEAADVCDFSGKGGTCGS